MGGWFAVTWPAFVIGALVMTAIGALIVAAVLILETQRRRDQQASTFQDRLTEPIRRELGLAGVSVLATVHIPLWTASTRPAVITLTGHAPSRVLRDRAIQLVERESARFRYFRIEDRIRITRPGDPRQGSLAGAA